MTKDTTATDTAGMIALLTRASNEKLEVTAYWGGGAFIRRGVPALHPGTKWSWVVDRNCIDPRLGDGRSVTLHEPHPVTRLLPSHRQHHSDRQVDWGPSPFSGYQPTGVLMPLAATPKPLPCVECKGLGEMHVPAWMGVRPCPLGCSKPEGEPEEWTLTHDGYGSSDEALWTARCGDKSCAFSTWYSGVRGSIAPPKTKAIHHHRFIDCATLHDEHCHEMVAARVLAALKSGELKP